jgi:hypothetical protein
MGSQWSLIILTREDGMEEGMEEEGRSAITPRMSTIATPNAPLLDSTKSRETQVHTTTDRDSTGADDWVCIEPILPPETRHGKLLTCNTTTRTTTPTPIP